jgi:sigma-E factor negative regulatory protein RseA
MNSSGSSSEAMRQSLSALMDGRLEADAVDRACSAWAAQPAVRADWHAYHLIGDVLRSDELAATPARDAAFLDSLREKLAKEPVPLVPRASRWRQPLLVPAAAAAGFVAVAGVLVILRGAAPEGPAAAPTLASNPGGEVMVVNREVIRDARLDRYLAAHRKMSGTGSMQVPGAVVRSVDTVVLETK